MQYFCNKEISKFFKFAYNIILASKFELIYLDL